MEEVETEILGFEEGALENILSAPESVRRKAIYYSVFSYAIGVVTTLFLIWMFR